MNHPISFVGAGPGDPELITVKGRRLLEEADLVVYAGSLVPAELLEYCRNEAETVNSAPLTLSQTHGLLAEGYRNHLRVVRLHTGDPSLYGAIREQMTLLDRENIPYIVVPGVSAVFAAAATLKKELTLPEISQTVIITRIAGRTPVPENEALAGLAAHRSTLIIYLSVKQIDEIADELSRHYEPTTPVVVAYRVGWPDEQIIRGSLANIAQKVNRAGIARHALVMVGEVFAEHDPGTRSRLYSEHFSHGCRHGD